MFWPWNEHMTGTIVLNTLKDTEIGVDFRGSLRAMLLA